MIYTEQQLIDKIRKMIEEFLKLDEKYEIINYVAECPDVSDSLTSSEMVEEIE